MDIFLYTIKIQQSYLLLQKSDSSCFLNICSFLHYGTSQVSNRHSYYLQSSYTTRKKINSYNKLNLNYSCSSSKDNFLPQVWRDALVDNESSPHFVPFVPYQLCAQLFCRSKKVTNLFSLYTKMKITIKIELANTFNSIMNNDSIISDTHCFFTLKPKF